MAGWLSGFRAQTGYVASDVICHTFSTTPIYTEPLTCCDMFRVHIFANGFFISYLYLQSVSPKTFQDWKSKGTGKGLGIFKPPTQLNEC